MAGEFGATGADRSDCPQKLAAVKIPSRGATRLPNLSVAPEVGLGVGVAVGAGVGVGVGVGVGAGVGVAVAVAVAVAVGVGVGAGVTFATVTARFAEVVFRPERSVIRAVRTFRPSVSCRLSRVSEYGEVESDPIDRPSTKNSTRDTPPGALASAVMVTVPRTVAEAGPVIETVGPFAAAAAVTETALEASTPAATSRTAGRRTGKERKKDIGASRE